MIKFTDGLVDKPNATVKFGELEMQAKTKRDDEGNVEVTVEMELEPDHGDSVHLIMHAENNSEYKGVLHKEDGQLVFKGQ